MDGYITETFKDKDKEKDKFTTASFTQQTVNSYSTRDSVLEKRLPEVTHQKQQLTESLNSLQRKVNYSELQSKKIIHDVAILNYTKQKLERVKKIIDDDKLNKGLRDEDSSDQLRQKRMQVQFQRQQTKKRIRQSQEKYRKQIEHNVEALQFNLRMHYDEKAREINFPSPIVPRKNTAHYLRKQQTETSLYKLNRTRDYSLVSQKSNINMLRNSIYQLKQQEQILTQQVQLKQQEEQFVQKKFQQIQRESPMNLARKFVTRNNPFVIHSPFDEDFKRPKQFNFDLIKKQFV